MLDVAAHFHTAGNTYIIQNFGLMTPYPDLVRNAVYTMYVRECMHAKTSSPLHFLLPRALPTFCTLAGGAASTSLSSSSPMDSSTSSWSTSSSPSDSSPSSSSSSSSSLESPMTPLSTGSSSVRSA